MSEATLRQQINNYIQLFKQLTVSYYKHQKKAFWSIQLLSILSTSLALFWIFSIILGISHYQNPANTQGLKYQLFAWVFALPLWQWLIVASSAGLISAWTSFLTMMIGKKSALDYQKHISKRCLEKVSNPLFDHWPKQFLQTPRQTVLRILKQGVQLTGLTTRRITLSFVSLFTFIAALAVLFYLDAMLLLLLFPLALLYLFILSLINRYTAQTSIQAAETLPKSNYRFNQLLTAVLNRDIKVNSPEFEKIYDESLYIKQADLKYQRRLAEVHVSWLNTGFTVLAIALIILHVVYTTSSKTIDWQKLLFFLIALKYAASNLQQVSSLTVAFSRFMPEIQLVFRLLNTQSSDKTTASSQIKANAIIYTPSSHLESFELLQVKNNLSWQNEYELISLAQCRQIDFKTNMNEQKQIVLIHNNLKALQTLINNQNKFIERNFTHFIIYSHQPEQIQYLTLQQFLQATDTKSFSNEQEIDAYE